MQTETSDLISQFREAAQSLAVEYAAYVGANEKGDHNGLIVWGGMLLETQAALGVELVDPEKTRERIAALRKSSKLELAA